MKFNKKLFSLLFVALLAIVLVGCNGGDDPTTEAPTTQAPTTQAPTTAGPVDFQPALDHLDTEYADTLLNDNFEATEDLTLINSFGDFTFTWSSSNTDLLANDGTINRPLLTEGNQTVILTVTISHGEESATQDFFVTIKALEEKTSAEIADEVFLFVFAIPNNEFWTSADTLNLVANGEDTDGNEYPVTWTSSHPEYITTEGVITQPEGDNVDVTLTASITVNSTEFTQERVFTVAKMAEATEVATIAEAIALGEDTYVVIPGVTVVAMYSSGDVFFTDGTDILYIYSPPFDAVVGNVYDITGMVDFYYNAPQLTGSDTHPLRAADSTAAVTSAPVATAAGIEDIIAATSVPTTAAPHEYIQYEVTASVYYEESWGNYSLFLVPTDYDFNAALATGATQPNGDAIMIYYRSDMDTLKSFHGQEITITIIMQGYRTDKSVFYANFFGTAEDVQLSFSNDADAIDAALGLVEFPYTVVETETFDLITSIYGVTIAYTTDNATVFDTATGTIDVSSLTVQTTITVTATATKGTETSTKAISIKVGPLPTSDISAVLDFPNSDLAKIEGTVVAGGYYRLFFIQDGTDNIALYVRDAALITLLENNVGNVVSITGSKSTYNGLHQLSVSEATFVAAGTAVTATNIDALTLDEAGLLAHQGELVELTGMVITDVYVDKYGNYQFTLERISDGEEIKLRWDSRYDLPTALETEMMGLAVGDKVTVTTVLSWYYGPQLALVTTTTFVVTDLTDQEALDLDAKDMPETLTLTEDMVIPTGTYGTTYEVTSIFGNASNYIDVTTTIGTLTVTQPYGYDTTAVMTVLLTNGAVTMEKTVDVTVEAVSVSSQTVDLFFSEYAEGSSNNKWVEIYNGTGADVDLSAYVVELYSNGATVATQTMELSGILADGDVYVITTDQAMQAIQDKADSINGYPSVVHYNGDDAVVLRKDGTIIDTVLNIGHTADDKVAAELTWVRNPSILQGNTTFDLTEWTEFAQDNTDDLGVHTVDTIVMTDQIKLEVDKAELDENDYIYSAQDVTLPTTGSNGSTITWAIASDTGTNASLVGNVLTLAAVADNTTAEVVVEATLTLNAASVTATYTFILVGETNADKLAQDVAELEALGLGGDTYTEVSVSLPTVGTKGSTIAWVITTDDDLLATLTGGNLVINRAEGTDSVVVLTATVTNGSETETIVVTYTMYAEVTTLAELHTMTDGTNYDIPTGTELYVVGVITADVYDGLFIQDINGDAIFVDGLNGLVGDKVLLKGTLIVNNSVRKLDTASQVSILSSGNALVYADLTADQIVALDASDAGMLIRFTGIEVVDLGYHAKFAVTGTAGSVSLGLSYFGGSSNADIHWLEDAFAVGDALPEAIFVFYDFAYGNSRIESLDIEFTDDLKIQADVNALPDSLTLTSDYLIPTATYASYTLTNVSVELDAAIDELTTPGKLLVTRPAIGSPDAVGTITIDVAFGTGTTVQKVINVTVPANYDTTSETTYTETFTNFVLAGTSYADGTFTGDNAIDWAYTESRGDFTLNGTAIMLDKDGDGASLSATIQGGIYSFSVDYYDAYGGAAVVELWINGQLIASSAAFDDDGDGTVFGTFTVDYVAVTGQFTMEIRSGASQMVIDNLTWTSYSPA